MPATRPSAAAPSAKPGLPKGLGRLPIFTQVMALCLSVLLVSILTNIGLVVFMPPPKPSGYTISEAAQALKTGTAKLRNGRVLQTQIVAEKPAFANFKREDDPRGQSTFEDFMHQRLAQALGISPDYILVSGPSSGQRRFNVDRMNIRIEGPRPLQPAFLPLPRNAPSPPRRKPYGDVPPGPGGPDGPRFLRDTLMAANLPPSFNEQVSFPPFDAAVKLPDGRYRILIKPKRWLEPWQINLLLGFALTAALIAPLAWLLSRRLTRPIAALAEGAARLDFDPAAEPLAETGPAEVRRATHVLNAMQVRIRQHIESRTAVIAAIAHDLKTPLARLRLRIETLPAKERDKIAQDIAHMDSLIRSAMAFASTEKMTQNIVHLDISALSESLAEDMAELHLVKPDRIEPHLTVMGDAVALKRVLCNLFENAHRYAGGSRLSVHNDGANAVITLSDDGPGIPDADLEAVFEPFHRLEASRNRDTGGAGLGLSVARALAEAHSGSLRLRNRVSDGQVCGLDAILTLPLAD